MVTAHLYRGKAILAGLVTGIFAVLLTTLAPATPAQAASTIQIDWVNATTLHLGGSAVQTPVNITGDFVGNVAGTPPGSQTFMAASSGPVQMSFGCAVSMTIDIFPDATGKLDYSKGEIVFTTSAPSTCSQDTLKANIAGLVHNPSTGTANISLMNASIGSVDKRGPAGGNDSADKQTVNVTAGMGPASDYNGIPQTDVFMLCEAKGAYVNNIDALIADCLAKKSGALSANPITSNNLETLKDGKGPGGGDEKGWTGQFKNVKAGVYMVCSTNFKSCQLFTKNPGEVANVYVIYGSTAGSTIPGTPPGQGADEKVCTTGEGLAGNLAWVLCPAVQLIAGATQFFEENIIIPFMTVSPLTTNADNPIYILWQNVRNVTNVGFIVFFLIAIFSQVTGMGISNYGLKRIAPKAAFVVVFGNLSYFLAAFAIDAFNIFGAGISQLVMAALQQAGTTQLNSGTSAGTVRSIFTLGGAALVTIVASGGAAIGWLFSFLGLILLIVVVVVVVMVIRQMLLIALVIAAPAIILMKTLPNTEPTADKGISLFFKLLLMYPQIVLLFAAGKIFGVVLQQPDFKIAGDGISDEIAQAIRVILQALLYVLPLLGVLGTFAGGGAIMGKATSFLHNARTKQMAQRGGKSFNEGYLKPRRAEMRMRAARRGGPIGWAAGYGYRRDFKKEQRERELGRAKQEYLANQVLDNEGLARSAAGIGGQAAVTRVQANAVSQQEKTHHEEMQNEAAIFASELRNMGTNAKDFNRQLTNYLNGTGPAVATGTTGHQVNMTNPRIMRAALNAAAEAGEVGTIESARLNNTIDQGMVDEIIRNNDGKLKGKGGFHLATNFNLAAGRMTQSDATGKAIPGTQINTLAGMKTEMSKQRLISIANTDASSIADMKSGLLKDFSDSILQRDANGKAIGISPAGANLMAGLDPSIVKQLRARMLDITSNQNLIGKAQNREAIQDVSKYL